MLVLLLLLEVADVDDLKSLLLYEYDCFVGCIRSSLLPIVFELISRDEQPDEVELTVENVLAARRSLSIMLSELLT